MHRRSFGVDFLPLVHRSLFSIVPDYKDSRSLPEAIYTDGQHLVILRKHGGVAMMGGCTRCGGKFFTPSRLCQDAFERTQPVPGYGVSNRINNVQNDNP